MFKQRKTLNTNINGMKFTDEEVKLHNEIDPITEAAINEIKAGNTEGKLDLRVIEEEQYLPSEEELNGSETEIESDVELEIEPLQAPIGMNTKHKFDADLCKQRAGRQLNQGYRDLSLAVKMPQFTFLETYKEVTHTLKEGTREVTFKQPRAERPLPAVYSPFVYPLICIVRNVNLRHPELVNNTKLAQLTNILNQGLIQCGFSDVMTVHYIMAKMISAFIAVGIQLHPELVKHASTVWDDKLFGKRPEWLLDVPYVNPYI